VEKRGNIQAVRASTAISVTGGFVYRGNDVPALSGRYVYGDFGTGRIWALDASAPARPQQIAQAASIASFGEDQRGELYVVDLSGGVSKFVPASGQAATPLATP
jgi:hypothetical protein